LPRSLLLKIDNKFAGLLGSAAVDDLVIMPFRAMYKKMLPDLLHNYHQLKKLRKFYGKLNKRL
jgi:hypothetical protein